MRLGSLQVPPRRHSGQRLMQVRRIGGQGRKGLEQSLNRSPSQRPQKDAEVRVDGKSTQTTLHPCQTPSTPTPSCISEGAILRCYQEGQGTLPLMAVDDTALPVWVSSQGPGTHLKFSPDPVQLRPSPIALLRFLNVTEASDGFLPGIAVGKNCPTGLS